MCGRVLEFNTARGHKIHRENYIAEIKSLRSTTVTNITPENSVSAAPGDTVMDAVAVPQASHFSISKADCMRQRGQVHVSGMYDNWRRNDSSSQLLTIEVNRNELISDGANGYFIHIDAAEMERLDRGSRSAAPGVQNNYQSSWSSSRGGDSSYRAPGQRYNNSRFAEDVSCNGNESKKVKGTFRPF